jgi:hypothetical protein
MERIASCACGGLRAICSGEPAKVSLCHCDACKRRTGSAFGIAAFFSRGAVRIEGPSRRYTRPSDSGFDVAHHFCPDCGATVCWEPARKPDMIAVALGAFADRDFPAPTQAVYETFRYPWLRDGI